MNKYSTNKKRKGKIEKVRQDVIERLEEESSKEEMQYLNEGNEEEEEDKPNSLNDKFLFDFF